MFGTSCAQLSVARLEEGALEERAHDSSALHSPFEQISVSIGKSRLDVSVAREKRYSYIIS
jgi:hypothetical protein